MQKAGETSNTVLPTQTMWNHKLRKRWFIAYAIGPSLLGYILFTLYPNIVSVYYSFLEWNGISEAKFVGLFNYRYMFQDHFVWRALSHNLLLMLTIPVITVLLSLILAYLLNYKNYREANLYKVLFFLPNVLAVVVVALMWSFIYDGSFGMLNAVLELFGIDNNDYYWLGYEKTALWALLPPLIWGGVGFYIIIFMNAMKAIPHSLYEAAILEGANHMTRLFRITFPLIAPIMRVSYLFMAIGIFKLLEFILILTNGGPSGSTEVIGLYMFNMAFGDNQHNYGYASTIGMFLFVIMIIAKLLIDRLGSRDRIEF